MKISVVLSIFIFNSACSVVYAQINNEKITIVTEHLPPFQIAENERVLDGMAFEIVQAMQDSLDYPFEIKAYPWARAYQKALSEKNTLIFSIARTQLRENLFKWVGEVYHQQDYLWRLKSRPNIRLETLEQARQYVIAVPRDDNQYQYLTAKGFSEPDELYLVTNWQQAIGMLRVQRVDLIMGTPLALAYYAKSIDLTLEDFAPALKISDKRDSLYIALSLQTPDGVFKDYQQSYRKLVRSGRLAEIQSRWETREP